MQPMGAFLKLDTDAIVRSQASFEFGHIVESGLDDNDVWTGYALWWSICPSAERALKCLALTQLHAGVCFQPLTLH